MMKFNFIFIISIFFSFLYCSSGYKCLSKHKTRLKESCSVYNVVIDSLYFRDNPENTFVVISDSSRYQLDPRMHYVLSLREIEYFILDSTDYNTSFETKMDFIVHIRKVNEMSKYYKSDYNIYYYTYHTLKNMSDKERKLFSEFKSKSNGIMVLSQVGFDESFTHALLYYSVTKSLVNGWGGLIYLKKENNIWRIEKKMGLWIS